MKPAQPSVALPTIRFSAELVKPVGGKNGAGSVLTLPKGASVKLAVEGKVMVEATMNGFPFRAALEPNGKGSHELKVNPALYAAAVANVGDMVMVEITRVGDEPELRVPADLRAALAAAPRAQAIWIKTTPMARRDWILWLLYGKLEETRRKKLVKACSMLAAGKKRVCCFGGLNWLRKDHGKAGESWGALPTARKG